MKSNTNEISRCLLAELLSLGNAGDQLGQSLRGGSAKGEIMQANDANLLLELLSLVSAERAVSKVLLNTVLLQTNSSGHDIAQHGCTNPKNNGGGEELGLGHIGLNEGSLDNVLLAAQTTEDLQLMR